MPPEEGDSPVVPDPVADAVAAVDVQLSQTPDAVRNTPEFRALEKQLRSSAREVGRAKAAEMVARNEAESYRQAAEAERQAALEAELGSLDPAAMAAYTELAELGQTDPVAAARRFTELLASAQSVGQPVPPVVAPTKVPEGLPVPAAPRPISGGVDGNAPLTQQPGEDIGAMTAALDARYAEVVGRNQDPLTRNRVTMKERSSAFIAYLGSAYLKATEHK